MRVCVSICALMRTMMPVCQREVDVTVDGRSCLGRFPAIRQAALSHPQLHSVSSRRLANHTVLGYIRSSVPFPFRYSALLRQNGHCWSYAHSGPSGSLGSAASSARCVSGARLIETTQRWAGYGKRQRSEARALDGHIIQRPGRGSYYEKRERHAQYVFRIFSNVLLFSQLLSFRIYEEAVYGQLLYYSFY